ncbi:MDR family MFS transporter [Geomicrobium sediminis]|uniref:DHA2 family lincomycin resistance protein-like MFS transporter n=1 Tax=Geomicrobium sediminis TaxID=1347788 RepID=A0ABS2P9F5_9BACL|nr:MDR family MFS transporter [Geomicrobium sediminis]MBM7632030.1 DHA2 family lincomycin resistance protein-like MFS transporter [Geomicrobium sediminis]
MAHTATEADLKSDIPDIRPIPILAVLLSGAFVAILNETILNVALQAIMGDLGVTSSTAQWLVTSYMLVIGTLIPISAYFIKRFTTRQLFITAMSLFTLGTVIAGVSPTFAVLLIGRITQAVGTAIMIPLLMNVILAVIPVERRGAAMGMMGLVIMFAPAIGPTVSGLIIESLTWRWLFYLVIPIALFSLVFGYFVLKNVTETSKPKLDVFSFILSTIGFGGIVFGFSTAGKGDSSLADPLVIASLVIGLLALVTFAIRQLKMEEPLLDIRVFRFPMFALGLVLVMLVMMTMFALMLVLPMYMQSALLFTAVATGLIMLPGGIINGAMSPIMGRLFDKVGPRPILIPGAIMLVITVFTYRFSTPGVDEWVLALQHVFVMVSVAMIMMPAQTNGLNQLPKELYPHGTAIFNTLMQVSGAIGAAIFISIMETGRTNALSGIQNPSAEQQIEAATIGAQQSFSFGLIFAVIALLIALFIRSKNTKNPA